MGMRYTDDGVSIENFPLMTLFQNAYGVGKDRISGTQDWMNSERYDIEAKIDPARVDDFKKLTPAEMKLARQYMLQMLLADRFKLTLHRETKELAVYNLVVGKNGSKLQETKPEDKSVDADKSAKDSLATSLGQAKGGPSGPSSTGGGNAGGGKSVIAGPLAAVERFNFICSRRHAQHERPRRDARNSGIHFGEYLRPPCFR